MKGADLEGLKMHASGKCMLRATLEEKFGCSLAEKEALIRSCVGKNTYRDAEEIADDDDVGDEDGRSRADGDDDEDMYELPLYVSSPRRGCQYRLNPDDP